MTDETLKVVDEKEYELNKKKLLERLGNNLDPKNFADNNKISRYEINWIEDCDSCEEVRKKNLDLINKQDKLFFFAHAKDKVRGRPQLIENVKKRIVLIKKLEKIDKNSKDEIGLFTKMISYKFLGELMDSRYDGKVTEILALDFWLYKIISEEGKEYFIFSQKLLPNEICDFSGMLIELDDFAEFSRNMKIKSLSNAFILKEFEASIKTISPQELVKFTKEKDISEKDWLEILAYHPNGNLNRFPEDVEKLRSAFVLSGKAEGYPLHMFVVGRAGTKKTMGHIETLGYKFAEEPSICEGANSRIKALSPSFKEKPADIGFLAKAHRIGFIDELGKMVELESNKHEAQVGNILGELNFLLEHKKRIVGSGNNNEIQVQATAKNMIVTNPVGGKANIQEHVGLIDPTMLSRVFVWVQDEEETKFCLSPESIEACLKSPPHTNNSYTTNINKNISHEKSLGVLSLCWGKLYNRDNFLTIFDSCYAFLSEMDDLELKKLVNLTINQAQEPMKSSVWKPRALHHVKLIVDGLVKHRCLFKDYDSSFKAKSEDYELALKILLRMVKGWTTSFSINWRDSFK